MVRLGTRELGPVDVGQRGRSPPVVDGYVGGRGGAGAEGVPLLEQPGRSSHRVVEGDSGSGTHVLQLILHLGLTASMKLFRSESSLVDSNVIVETGRAILGEQPAVNGVEGDSVSDTDGGVVHVLGVEFSQEVALALSL